MCYFRKKYTLNTRILIDFFGQANNYLLGTPHSLNRSISLKFFRLITNQFKKMT